MSHSNVASEQKSYNSKLIKYAKQNLFHRIYTSILAPLLSSHMAARGIPSPRPPASHPSRPLARCSQSVRPGEVRKTTLSSSPCTQEPAQAKAKSRSHAWPPGATSVMPSTHDRSSVGCKLHLSVKLGNMVPTGIGAKRSCVGYHVQSGGMHIRCFL
jgi:hypothetical protein